MYPIMSERFGALNGGRSGLREALVKQLSLPGEKPDHVAMRNSDK